jgi:hypothetical protein
VAQGDRDSDGDERHVDPEHPSPRHGIDEPSTEERTEGGGDAGEPRPRADCPATILWAERGRDDREAPGHEHRGGDPLERPRRDQERDRRRESADGGGGGEADEAEQEHASPSEQVAERASEDEERAEREEVRGEHPLHRRQTDTEVTRDGGERGVDDRTVEERDSRTEHRGGDDPPPGGGTGAQVRRWRRLDRRNGDYGWDGPGGPGISKATSSA